MGARIPRPANRLRGAKAQNQGKVFERAFETICAQNNYTCVRIPDSCKQIGRERNGAPRLIRVKSPFDFVIASKGFSVFLDVKSTESDRYTYSQLKQHQIDTLHKVRKDVLSGYLVHFALENKIVFFDVNLLAALKPRESVSIESGLLLGTFGYQCDLERLRAHFSANQSDAT